MIQTRFHLGILTAVMLAIGACSQTSTEVPISPSTEQTEDEAHFTEQRMQLVESGIVGMGIDSAVVIDAMRSVPRHRFVPEQYLPQAYANHPLPIGYGQTISQPYIVALMTEALELEPGDKVLEIGTGSGYQAAVLAEVGAEVYSVEIIAPLAESATELLVELGYDDISVKNADGYFGWIEHAPFDAIIVTAAPDHVPHPLLEQLKIDGLLVIPVGPVGGYQELWKIQRVAEDQLETSSLGGVRFVPFTRTE